MSNDPGRLLLRRLNKTISSSPSATTPSAGSSSATRPAYVVAACSCLVFLLLLSACTSTRPVVKIGLLAPFEGLYRQSGYEALAAMRAALADHQPPNVEVLPLALDTSADPEQARRAAAKLLRDDSVVAVIGPLQSPQVAAAAELIAASRVDWHLPLAPRTPHEEQALFAAILTQIDGLHILQAGPDTRWPDQSADGVSTFAAKGNSASSVDGVLWQGDARTGAAFLTRLRTYNPTVPFWTTGIGGDPVFSLLLSEYLGEETLGPVYWGIVLDGSVSEDQLSEWTANRQPSSPTAFAVYLATQNALEQIAGTARPSVAPKLAIFRLDHEGSSHLVEFVPLP